MALGQVLARLSVELGLDTAAFSTGSRRASKEADVLGARMEKMGQRVGTAIKGFVAVYAVAQLQNLARAGLATASALGEQATQLGISSTALQEYRYAATQTGLTSVELEKGLAQLTRRIGEAALGNKDQAESFRSLGIAVKDAKGNVLNTADALPKLADALEKVEDPARRSAISAEFFGSKLGGKFLTLLDGGSRAIQQLRKDAHDLGLVLSEDEIRNADRTADKLSQLYNVLGTSVAGVVAKNADSIYNLASALARLTGEAIRFISEYPRLSAALAGAAVGARVGGLPGALVGAGVGFVGGDVYARGQTDANSNLKFRQKALADALASQKRFLAPQKFDSGGGLFKLRNSNADPSASLEGATAEVRRQTGLLRAATAAARAPASAEAAALGADATGGAGSSKRDRGGGGSSGPSAAEIESRFQAQRRQLGQQALAALQATALTAEDRAEFEARSLEHTRLDRLAELKGQKDINAEQREVLRVATERVNDAEAERAAFDRRREEEDQAEQVARQESETQRERLQLLTSLAATDAERQKLALETLAAEQAYQRGAAARVIASDVRTDIEKAEAQRALNRASATDGLARLAAERGSETRTQGFLRSINQTPGQISEAIDGIRIDGLDRLNEGLVDAITGVKSLGAVFRDIASQIVADLLRIAIRQTIIKSLSAALFGGTGGGGTGGGGTGIFGEINNIPRFASGTMSAPRGLALVGERGPELVRFGGGERVFPNGTGPRGGGGGSRIEVIPSPYFNVVVDGRIVGASPAIMSGGAQVAAQRGARAQSRRLA